VVAGTEAGDVRWMQRALALAGRGLGRTTPNPTVGACVVTDEGVVIGHGSTEPPGGRHAEIVALDAAGDRARGSTLYSTLEPCVHTGRTGPCTRRIIAAGIRRVVASVQDPDPRVNGRGFAELRDAGVVVDMGICREEAVRLNDPFFTAVRKGRPFVILKAATSLDARIGDLGRRTWMTSPPSDRIAQFWRARVDAIAVGSETLLVDDPLLTAREVFRARPLTRVVFDRRLRTPPTARMLSTLDAGPVIIMTSQDAQDANRDAAAALERAGATVIAEREPGIAPLLRRLMRFDIQSLLLEGGAEVHRSAWNEGVVDYVQMFITPRVLGAGGVPIPDELARAIPSLVDARVQACGPDVIIEGYVHRTD
jgi:diaminohydroxyphosphoribosylaminopyrimidine deaminase / 5-amino-6-(5-phosphoribosylamino)uracil reductase